MSNRPHHWSTITQSRFHFSLVLLFVAFLGGCAGPPPDSGFPSTTSSALAHPEETRLGQQFENASREHAGHAGFRIIPVGADRFLARMQMINTARKTLGLQYLIFRCDDNGQQLTRAVLHAADRGVRVRVCVLSQRHLARLERGTSAFSLQVKNGWRLET